jgi:hypothetical protein
MSAAGSKLINNPVMHTSDVRRAVAAAMSTASRLGLTADHAVILRDSNKLTARLLPSDVVARVS